MIRAFILLLLCFTLSTKIHANQISFSEILSQFLNKNYQLQIDKVTLEEKQLQIAIANGAFDLIFSTKVLLSQADGATMISPDAKALARRLNWQSQFSKAFKFGGRLELGSEITMAKEPSFSFPEIEPGESPFAIFDRLSNGIPMESIDRSYTMFRLTYLQPLYRNLGSKIGNTPDKLARLERDITKIAGYKNLANDLAALTRGYLELRLNYEEIKIYE